jgi:hypothetical protein
MNTTSIAVLVLVIAIIIIGAVYFAYTNMHKASQSTVSTTVVNTTTAPPVTTVAATTSTIKNTSGNSTYVSTTTVPTTNSQNDTLTDGQVVSALGTGWTFASQYNSNVTTKLAYANGTNVTINAWGTANFTHTGELLTDSWYLFESPGSAKNYVNSTFKAMFPNATNVTVGTVGNATYMFYSGDAITKGQAAGYIYAYDGSYGILISNQATVLQLAQAKQLLANQTSDLKLS